MAVKQSSLQSASESASAQVALSNSVILRNILKGVNDPECFLKGRLVSKFWSDEITSLLLSSFYDNAIEIKFKWKEDEEDFKKENEAGKGGSLFQLIQLYRNSNKLELGKFPCNSFVFKGCCYDNSDFQTFFSENGASIQNLTLHSKTRHENY